MGTSHGKMKNYEATGGNNSKGNTYELDYHPQLSLCKSCSVWQDKAHEYIDIGEGRKLCPYCYDSAIMTDEHCKPLIDNVKEFFKRRRITLKKGVPVFLASEDEIKRVLTKCGRHVKSDMTYYGLATMYPVRIQRVTGFFNIRVGEVGVNTDTKKLSRGRRKSSILLCYGYPWLKAGAILAHEMTHAWFNERGLNMKLSEEVEEGFCELVSHEWVLEQPMAMGNEHKHRLRDIVLKCIRTDNDVAGTGFRKAKLVYEKYDNDLEATLNAVTRYRKFPS